MKINARLETWALRRPFRISGAVFVDCRLLVVTVEDNGVVGRGEASGVGYLGETPERLLSQVEEFARTAPPDLTTQALQSLLPPGGARNAVDCALWELNARQERTSVCELAGVGAPRKLNTAYTIGADAPDDMAAQAVAYGEAKILKLKLTGDVETDTRRLDAVRRARPDVVIAVDANRGFQPAAFREIAPALKRNGVRQVEQPFPVGAETNAVSEKGMFEFIADEAVQTADDLAQAGAHFDAVNIKLDKAGGLTHALEMARRARDFGLKPMVGNMVGTSWSQAASFVVGQLCDFVDLDGVLFLERDRTPGGVYEDGAVWFGDDVWGGPSYDSGKSDD